MTQDAYEFDVAISFGGADEAFATQLHNLLSERMRVFLYTKKQELLAGTDGEQRLNEVFSEKSHLVVVLFRDAWGKTPFTRVEETAIRNRAHSDGFDFTVFVPMDDTERQKIPKWVPKTRISVDHKRWGLEGVAAAIEARLIDLGGQIREATLEDLALRAARAIEFKRLQELHLSSTEGVVAQSNAFAEMRSSLFNARDTIAAAIPTLGIHTKDAGGPTGGLLFVSAPAVLQVAWRLQYSNTLADAKLEATIWRGHPPWPGVMLYEEPKRLASLTFLPDLLADGQPGWLQKSASHPPISTAAATDAMMKLFLAQVHKASLAKGRS